MNGCHDAQHAIRLARQVTVGRLGLLLGTAIAIRSAAWETQLDFTRKRPLDNMCPTIVLRAGRPMLSIGAVGGRRIPNAIFQVLMNIGGWR